MMGGLRFDVLTDVSELADIDADWRNLIAGGCLPSAFQHPGRQASLAGIRHFISEGLPIFDFGRGDEEYKFVLGARARDLRGITLKFGS